MFFLFFFSPEPELLPHSSHPHTYPQPKPSARQRPSPFILLSPIVWFRLRTHTQTHREWEECRERFCQEEFDSIAANHCDLIGWLNFEWLAQPHCTFDKNWKKNFFSVRSFWWLKGLILFFPNERIPQLLHKQFHSLLVCCRCCMVVVYQQRRADVVPKNLIDTQ